MVILAYLPLLVRKTLSTFSETASGPSAGALRERTNRSRWTPRSRVPKKRAQGGSRGFPFSGCVKNQITSCAAWRSGPPSAPFSPAIPWRIPTTVSCVAGEAAILIFTSTSTIRQGALCHFASALPETSKARKELMRRGHGYRKNDNHERRCRIADSFNAALIQRRLDYFDAGPPLFTPRTPSHLVEASILPPTDRVCHKLIFRRNFPIHKLFERSCDLGLYRLSADKISQIFGFRLHRRPRASSSACSTASTTGTTGCVPAARMHCSACTRNTTRSFDWRS